MSNHIVSDWLVKYVLRQTTDNRELRDVFRAIGFNVDEVEYDRILTVREMIGYTTEELMDDMTAKLTEAGFTELKTDGGIEHGQWRVTFFRKGERMALDLLVKAHRIILDNYKSVSEVTLQFSEPKRMNIFRMGHGPIYHLRCTYVFIDDPNLSDTPEPPKKKMKSDHYDTQ
jgi:hypothetical protein